MLQLIANHPEIIVASTVAVEVLRGNGGRMGEQIKDGIMQDPLGKVMLAIVTALVLWVGNNTQGNSLKLAALETKIESLSEDRYTSAQAALLAQRLTILEQSIKASER